MMLGDYGSAVIPGSVINGQEPINLILEVSAEAPQASDAVDGPRSVERLATRQQTAPWE